MFRPLLFAALLTSCAHANPCMPGQFEMSVEGQVGIYCVDQSPICIANISTGACPSVSEALPSGSYCGIVATGVYGCKTGSAPVLLPMEVPDEVTDAPTPAPTAAPIDAPTPAPTQAPTTNALSTTTTPTSPPTPSPTDGSQCVDGDYEMSVEGVPGIFCLSKGPICMADISTGTCPGPQNGLPYGSYCGKVASGVYGCKVNTGDATPAPVPLVTTVSPPPAPTPAPTVASTITTPAPVPSWTTVAPSPAGTCANGSPMSVEGVAPIFCVPEPACVADRAKGNCPGAQAGLPWGSYCEIITRTGAFGCKPYNGTNIKNSVVYPAVRSCVGNSNGETPVSVVSAGTFCAAQPVCAGAISGNCPKAQESLGTDSICTLVRPNVYGCVTSA